MNDIVGILILTGILVVLGLVLNLLPTGKKDVNVETTGRGTEVLHKH